MGFLRCVAVSAALAQEAMDGAAKEGLLDVIIWLHKNTNAGATKAAMVRDGTW